MCQLAAASAPTVGSATVIYLAVKREAPRGEFDSKPAVLGAEPPGDGPALAGWERRVPSRADDAAGEAVHRP